MNKRVSIRILKEQLNKTMDGVERAAVRFHISDTLENGRTLLRAIEKNSKAHHAFQYYAGMLLWPKPVNES